MAKPSNPKRAVSRLDGESPASPRPEIQDDSAVVGATAVPDALDAERRQLAERLRDTREFLGLSQQEAADTAGLTRLVISAIETGRRKVESVELGALARVYGQPVAYFLASGDAEDATQPEEVKFIARAAREMAAGDRGELLRFAEFLRTYRSPKTPTEGPAAEED
jgi:transcriptional regulator with XRE-family HTH domain